MCLHRASPSVRCLAVGSLFDIQYTVYVHDYDIFIDFSSAAYFLFFCLTVPIVHPPV